MNQEEFDRIIKRAMELHTQQTVFKEEEHLSQDLEAVAQRLGIPPEILEKATRDIRKEDHQVFIMGNPEQVKAKFLEQFLVNDTGSKKWKRKRYGPPLTIDREQLRASDNSVRAYHRSYPSISSTIRFLPNGPDNTIVSWTSNKSYGARDTFKILMLPLLPAAIAILSAGFSIPAIIMLIIAALVIWRIGIREKTSIEDTIVTYFENLQILSDLHEQSALKKEVAELRAQSKQLPDISPNPINIQTPKEMNGNPIADTDDFARRHNQENTHENSPPRMLKE